MYIHTILFRLRLAYFNGYELRKRSYYNDNQNTQSTQSQLYSYLCGGFDIAEVHVYNEI